MSHVVAVLSLLHEPGERFSATRLFRGEPVLDWTLRRLSRGRRVEAIALLCWEDQLSAVVPIAQRHRAIVECTGRRIAVPEIESIAAARRWADGWRGGLLASCHFDQGFHAPWHQELAQRLGSSGIVLVDPSSALIDANLIDALVVHAEANASLDFCLTPAAPGFGAVHLTSALLNRLASAKAHPGRLMHYHPDQLSREPLAMECCAPVPPRVARSARRFTFDSDRQVRQMTAGTECLNGELASASAEELVERLDRSSSSDELPREIVLELNTTRSTRPIYWPGRGIEIRRPELSVELATRLFDELGAVDDTRLTLAGVGDPLLAASVFEIIHLARDRGLHVHLETDLHEICPEGLTRLAAAGADVVSVHLPALTTDAYARVMGCDGYARVLDNVRQFITERQRRSTSLPLLAPLFIKCKENLSQMEAWYDQWLRAVGSAVVRGPSDCAGQIPDVAVADMSPPGRRPCARLGSRMSVLSDGTVVSCEEDVLGAQVMGRIGTDSVTDIWSKRFESLRSEHLRGQWGARPLCARCREWHRP